MDIREIVESTLIAPARAEAAKHRITQLELRIKTIECERDAWKKAYVTLSGNEERLIGKLLELLNNDDLDGARDLVKAEHDSIHGPND